MIRFFIITLRRQRHKEMAKSTITTGHYVRLSQATAGLGDRLLAQLLDFLIMMGYSMLLSMIMMFVWERFNSYGDGEGEDVMTVITVLLYVLPITFYHPVCEAMGNGQSIGKRALHIRVVKLDGSPSTLGSSLMRWALYPVDVLLTAGLGAMFILFSDHNQRMGDIAAGTTVVKLEQRRLSSMFVTEFNYILPGYRPVYQEAASLSINQLALISRVIYNNTRERQHYIDALAEKIRATLHVPPLLGANNEQFLRTIYNDAYHYNATITA